MSKFFRISYSQNSLAYLYPYIRGFQIFSLTQFYESMNGLLTLVDILIIILVQGGCPTSYLTDARPDHIPQLGRILLWLLDRPGPRSDEIMDFIGQHFVLH